MQLLKPSEILGDLRWQFEVIDDFHWFLSPHLWTTLTADGGTLAIDADGVGGVVQLVTGATDNDELCLATTNELFLFAADRTIYAEVRIQYTEASTDDANVMFGFMDAMGANALQDNGAGPAASFDGAIIYKVDGGTVWRCRTSNGTTNTDTISITTAGGASYVRLGMQAADLDGTNLEVTYFLDGNPLLDNTFRRPIKHTALLASMTEMDFGVYAKAGGSNAETINVDYVAAIQRRVST